MTALHLASQMGHVEVMKRLLEKTDKTAESEDERREQRRICLSFAIDSKRRYEYHQ